MQFDVNCDVIGGIIFAALEREKTRVCFPLF